MMRIHKIFRPGLVPFILLGILLCLPHLLFPQTEAAGPPEEPEEPVFAPFVSGLSAETRNNLVRLSWVDSPDIRGPVYIFRSTQPFETGQIPGNLRPLEASYGVQWLIDETEGSGTFHYFVAASDRLGRRYDIVIPYHNTLSVQINGAGGEGAAAGAGRALSPAVPGLFGLEARVEGAGVVLSYQSREAGKNTVLYRSVQPLRNTADLLRAVIIQSGPVAAFTDYPAPGVPYYYAVIFEDELVRGTVAFHPGQNVTVQPVEIPPAPGQAGPETPLRSMPLPLISVSNAVPGSDRSGEIPRAVPLGPGAARALEDIPRAAAGTPEKKPRAFSRDLEASAGGEESPLRLIVQGAFLRRNWQGAQTELLQYLSLPRPPLAEARARFYLGQAYYFSGNNRDALIEFLMVRPQYPEEAGEWIDAVLAAMIQ